MNVTVCCWFVLVVCVVFADVVAVPGPAVVVVSRIVDVAVVVVLTEAVVVWVVVVLRYESKVRKVVPSTPDSVVVPPLKATVRAVVVRVNPARDSKRSLPEYEAESLSLAVCVPLRVWEWDSEWE